MRVNICKKILYLVDFIGLSPTLHILNYDNYKTVFSSLVSICVIIFGFIYANISIIEFINQRPSINYFKNIDSHENKTINLNETFIMLKFEGYGCFSKDQSIYTAYYFAFNNDDFISIPINIEPCQIGKNINYKFKDTIEKFLLSSKNIYNLSEYYCLNLNNLSYPLYIDSYNNYAEMEIIILPEMEKEEACKNSYLFSLAIVTENDMINNNDKKQPIMPYFHYEKKMYNPPTLGVTKNYYYQYIKYKSDEDLFFENYKSNTVVGFSDLEELTDEIGVAHEELYLEVFFQMNNLNYDLYERSYRKIQSLLVDLTGIIRIVVDITRYVVFILLNKIMSRDIVKNIMEQDYNQENTNPNISRSKITDKLNKLYKNSRNQIILDNKNIKSNSSSIEKINKINNISDLHKDNPTNINNSNFYTNKLKTKESIKILKKREKIAVIAELLPMTFLKSIFCNKDNKCKLINICNELVYEDTCIDKILKRLYKLEKKYKILSKANIQNSKYQKVKYYISQIIIDDKKECVKKRSMKDGVKKNIENT